MNSLRLLVICALAFLHVLAAPAIWRNTSLNTIEKHDLAERADTCQATWPIQSADPWQDVYDVEKFFGLPIPVKATLLMLNHLDPTYLVAPEHNIPVSDCELRDKTRPSNRIDIYNAGNVCGIQVRLTAEEDMKYLVPDENKRFGLAPLIMKQVYNKLRLGVQYINVPGKPVANLGLTWGQSDATATQQFFSAVTSVKLASRTITEINAEGPASLRSILDKYRTSPVFFSTYTTIFVITGHEGDGKQRTWHMLGVRSTREQKWTEEQFQLFKDSTFLYQAEDGGLAAGREECLPADILG